MEGCRGRQVIPCPCYNEATKTDCSRRCAGCQVDCPDWADYVKRREEVYKERKLNYTVNSTFAMHAFDGQARRQKREIRDKRHRRSRI